MGVTSPPKPATAQLDAARQFDFWLGEWDCAWGEGERGTNSVYLDLGDHAAALEHSTQAIGISRGCGYRLDEAHALALSGRIHHARGDRVPARAACQRALDIYAQAGAPESAEIAAQLSRLNGA